MTRPCTTLRRYTRDEDDMEGLDRVGEDSGWKQVHGDVFRKPANLPVFASLVGTGWQLIMIVLSAVLFAILGEFHGEVRLGSRQYRGIS
jgi:transmembrane 9 superfamily protein 3